MESDHSRLSEMVRRTRERVSEELRAQEEQIDRVESGVRELRARQRQLQERVRHELELLEQAANGTGTRPNQTEAGGSYPAHGPESAVGVSDRVAHPAPAQQAQAGSSSPSDGAQPEKLQANAVRFAHLLVSEIELYHRDEVVAGREHRDLYRRLRSSIERSRQTYRKRFGNVAAGQSDYFHDELVKTLANHDASLLGEDYPGPRA